MNNAFNSVASSGFIFPAKTKLSCLRLNAASKRSCSSSVSGWGTSTGLPCRLLQQSVNGLISLCFITGLSIFYPDVNKISIELLKALETLASTVTTLPRGIALLKATLFTDAVTTILLECLRAQYLQHDPYELIIHHQRLFKGFVSLGNTKSVSVVRGFGCFGLILYVNVIVFFVY
jgi:hypothetical protein